MTNMLTMFVLALLATGAFSVIFRVPVRNIPVCMVIGAMGFIAYEISFNYYESPVIGCFFGACIVGLLSSFAARIFKDAETIFVIPGILCLVPGAGIFNTMAAVLKDDFSGAAEIGVQTLMMAGAIAVGLLTIGSILRVLYSMARKTVRIRDHL